MTQNERIRTVTRREMRKYYNRKIIKKREDDEDLFSAPDSHFLNFLNKTGLGNGAKALDLGYGGGEYTLLLAKKGFEVTAVDIIAMDHLTQQVLDEGLTHKINVIQADLNIFFPQGKYDLIICKNALYLFENKRVEELLRCCIRSTNLKGYNYINMFTDTKRSFKDGTKIVIEGEAKFSKEDFIKMVDAEYCSWQLEFKVRRRKEQNVQGLELPINFCADDVLFTAYKE